MGSIHTSALYLLAVVDILCSGANVALGAERERKMAKMPPKADQKMQELRRKNNVATLASSSIADEGATPVTE